MATTVTVGGVSVPLGRDHVPKRLQTPVGGVDTYTFEARVGALPATYSGMHLPIVVTVNGTVRFRGDIERCSPAFRSGLAWVRTYVCLGLRARGDWVGHVDSNTGSDASVYNATPDLDFVDYLPSRAGREVGEILVDVLTMPVNAAALDALGVGAYTSLSPPTLPASTLADLAALDRVLPGPLRFGGEKFLTAVDQFLSFAAVNHRMTVEPGTGALRFRDTLAFTPVSLTLGTDPVSPPELSRDVSECFTAVLVKGRPLAVIYPFALSLGTLTEDLFAYGALTVAAAKAAFTPADFYSPGCVDEGTCVVNTTTTLTVTSADAGVFWSADFWNQTAGKRYGQILLTYSLGTGITTMDSRLIVDSAALTAGGSALLTLDRPLPHLDFDNYLLKGRRGDEQNVYAAYQLPAWAGEKVAPIAAYSYPLRNAGRVLQTTTAMGQVLWSSSGTAPYDDVVIPVEVDADLGAVIFPSPTWIMAGNREPSDVRAFVPIYNDVNTVRKPASSYEGVGYTADGVQKVLTVNVPTWRDPANLAAMGDYAQDLLDSVKGPIIEGTVVYHGLLDSLLDVGISLDIDSVDFTTPWAGVELPVMGSQLEWGTSPGDATLWTISLNVSTRRAAFTSESYLSADRTGVTLDFGGGYLDLSFIGGQLTTPGQIIGGAMSAYGDQLSADASAAAAGPSIGLTQGDGKVDPGKATGMAPTIKRGDVGTPEEARKQDARSAQSAMDLARGKDVGNSAASQKWEAQGADNQVAPKQGPVQGEEREKQAERAEEARATRAVQDEQARDASKERDRRKKAGEAYKRKNPRRDSGAFGSGGTDGGLA